jgi:hypothetical protein
MFSARSVLFDSLKKGLLGPRNGTFEETEANPRGEYVVGVLEPARFVRAPLEYYRPVDLRLGDDEIREDDDVADYDVDNLSFNLDLDPRALPRSMGLSFILSSTNPSFIDILVTWARYSRLGKKKWRRVPSYLLLKEIDVRKQGKWEKEGLRVELRTSITKNQDYYVSLYLVNDTPLDDPRQATTEDLVFQPQIRVNCCRGAALVPVRGQRLEEDDEHNLSFLYSDRPTLARGHMCSAVWKEVDPERPFSNSEGQTSPHLKNPFISIERELLEKTAEEYFTNPDVRTEFLPCYSIPQVSYESREVYGEIPNITADQLSEAWEPKTLGDLFDPIVSAYKNWILDRERAAQNVAQPYQTVALRLVEKCRQSLKRIEEGLALLKEDDDLRLSFCFMNKVMDTQSRWKRGEPLSWRLFQTAFILQNIPSIAKKDHPDRAICDVLWFPTGGGKTEAYLGLLVLLLALRRRRGRKKVNGGSGTAVISRYTLRMLTIQQFRRALIAIVACDYLRTINWRPQGYSSKENAIWGTSRFSIGLWVGGEVTPNHLLDHKRFDLRTYQPEYFPGALGRLRGYDVYRQKGYRVVRTTENEPAQILNCPVCKSILAVPRKRILQSGKHQIHWIIYSPSKPTITTNFNGLGFKTLKVKVEDLPNPKYFVLNVEFSTSSPIGARDIDNWWTKIIRPKLDSKIKQAFARASRPGYFIKKWDIAMEDADFEIHCPNRLCQLNSARWMELIRGLDGKEIATEPLDPFSIAQETGISYSIPISAFVVDDQIYHRCPSLIVATVDKFARLPFEPKARSMFGNVDRYDSCWGYYKNTVPPERGGLHEGQIMCISEFDPPELIIQDELHLIEGPLGSMVGIYETAIEELASQKIDDSYIVPKYIASSATIQKAKPHIKAVFNRRISIFPPSGISIEDNFFSYTEEAHPIDSSPAGRLYMGVCAPGRGGHTPTIRIWSSLLQKVFELRNTRGDDEEVDQFWTLIGYFNALRELAQASSLYKIDIVERLRQTNASPRPLEPSLELSSRMDSSEIPVALNQLSRPLPENIVDAVLATSMFGTGVDVERLGLMVVHGQPKTTANYIQATGRVGRKMGGLVVAFYRSTRPRDLDHYEFFIGYHRCLHKYVEPISANPFSPRARERALGPIMVALLRNAEAVDGTKLNPEWSFEQAYTGSTKKIPISGSRVIKKLRKAKEVRKVVKILERRSQSQPLGRKPRAGTSGVEAESLLDRWKAAADSFNSLLYSETTMTKEPQYPVVLGDPQHKTHGLPIVFENTPQSLRAVEPTTRFEG